ncbi:ABC transporter ATP-binding protein [Novosphingobium acidiphilum]|uniref:ABC transporter ATP-binding protein n=1 Tax=Novosphingobium acidiphilum TaxID=505248 RepID=UPI0003FEB920|nr:ABC transporter ATP-binding protein [Novosphingobium acidiphilum]
MSAPVASWGTYRRLLPWIMPYRARLLGVLGISLLATGVGLVQPYLSKLMIDGALLHRDFALLVRIALLTVLVTVVGSVLNIASSYRYVALSAAMLYDIRVALLAHLQMLSPRFYARFRLGDLMSRINSDVSDVQRAAGDTLLAVLGNVLFLIGSLAMMAWLDWRLFVVGTVLVPVATGLFVWLQRRLVAMTRTMRERGADLGSFLVDTVMGMRVVTALGGEAHEAERFAVRNRAFVSAMLQMQMTSFMAGALPGAVLAASSAAVTLYGGWRILTGATTIGTLVAFMAYQSRLFGPVQSLLGLSSGLASTRVALGRIFELFDTPADVADPPQPRALPTGPLDVGFAGVHFRHDRDAVLAGVDFTIPAGAMVAILGASGAGKSTLADLIVRFRDPDAGQVRIGGIDARELSLAELRRAVVLIDQTPFLFNATMAENIAFAVADADRLAIQAAALAAGLGDLIARLPHGLDTPVGERGLALSTGERQRVALARALLRRPAVLVLDEPSAALDAETEARVAAGLRTMLPRATIVIITHKPALADLAQMVITLDHGRATVSTRG